jgi:hypothetical protein
LDENGARVIRKHNPKQSDADTHTRQLEQKGIVWRGKGKTEKKVEGEMESEMQRERE